MIFTPGHLETLSFLLFGAGFSLLLASHVTFCLDSGLSSSWWVPSLHFLLLYWRQTLTHVLREMLLKWGWWDLPFWVNSGLLACSHDCLWKVSDPEFGYCFYWESLGKLTLVTGFRTVIYFVQGRVRECTVKDRSCCLQLSLTCGSKDIILFLEWTKFVCVFLRWQFVDNIRILCFRPSHP